MARQKHSQVAQEIFQAFANGCANVDKIIDRHQFFPRSLLTTILDQGSLQS